MKLNTDHYRIKPGSAVDLRRIDSDDDGGLVKEAGEAHFAKLRDRLDELQGLLYAESRHSILIVLQAMDGGGKDSTIRSVFTAMNPQGVGVYSYKQPTDNERRHDFLWRIHQNAPHLGYISIFNRSHYEDVLVVRVKGLAPRKQWEKRYDHINHFEAMLHDEGTVVLKFFLHISKGYQKERLQRRLERKDKEWKFSPTDLTERKLWGDYQRAYEAALSRCSTETAPWYVIPAEHRWYRNLLVAQVLVDKLESLKMHYPKPDFDPRKIVVR